MFFEHAQVPSFKHICGLDGLYHHNYGVRFRVRLKTIEKQDIKKTRDRREILENVLRYVMNMR